MSGVNRNIKAENARKGLTGEAAMANFTPDKIRAEKGRSALNDGIVKNEDAGLYIGKNGYDATPGK